MKGDFDTAEKVHYLMFNVENGVVDSIRIENGVFQRITLINNTESY